MEDNAWDRFGQTSPSCRIKYCTGTDSLWIVSISLCSGTSTNLFTCSIISPKGSPTVLGLEQAGKARISLPFVK